MAGKPKKKVESMEVVESKPMAPMIQQPKALVLEGDPEAQLAYAQKAANALMKVVKPKEISGKKYLMFGAWQTLGRFFGSTVGVDWTQPLLDSKQQLLGYEARAVVYQNGQIISSAEASCMKTEKRWSTADEYAIKSMAQTRASAKALRNAFGWVAELGGYESTPAEEMPGDYDRSPIANNAKVKSTVDDEMAYYSMPNENHTAPPPEEYTSSPEGGLTCSDTGERISQAEYDYSKKFYGKPLSRAAQRRHPRIK